MKTIDAADTPPGSVIYKNGLVVRLTDGTGWCVEGATLYGRGWRWDLRGPCTLLLTGLTFEQTREFAESTSEECLARVLRFALPSPLPVEDKSPLVGVAVLVTSSGCTLLSRRLPGASDGVGVWSCPGGLVGDETILEAAARELREETGLELPDDAHVMMNMKESRRRDGRRCVCIYVGACYPSDASTTPIVSREPTKHSDWQWFDVAGLDQLDASRETVWDFDYLRGFLGGDEVTP